ncbi:MAG: hypothetical protein P1V97_30090 [Planctomycetota bacterium]|nr:hypothetical protein [Planctomycetota bacterium]
MISTETRSHIDVQCPSCERTFLAPSQILGGLGRCSKCQAEFTITSQNSRSSDYAPATDKLEWTQCNYCNAPFPISLDEFGLTIGCRNCGETFYAQRWDPTATRRMKAMKKAKSWDELKDYVRSQRKLGKPLNRIENELVTAGVLPETAQNVVNAVLTEDSHLMLKSVKKSPTRTSAWMNSALFALIAIASGVYLASGQVPTAPDAAESTKYLGLFSILAGGFLSLNAVLQYNLRPRPSN